MKLIVGLGNPGKKYIESRHNIGFMVVDMLARDLALNFKEASKFKAQMAQSSDVILCKPQTYMNDSGYTVAKVLTFFKIDPVDLVVIHDDVDFESMEMKITFGKGPGGHHGVEDIIEKLGGVKDFTRVRIGIGRPETSKFDVHDWVLSKLSQDELNQLESNVDVLKKSLGF